MMEHDCEFAAVWRSFHIQIQFSETFIYPPGTNEETSEMSVCALLVLPQHLIPPLIKA